jgi:peptidyl-dipeptidase Dcp
MNKIDRDRAKNRTQMDTHPPSELNNPLLTAWTAPHGLPPFADVTAAHFQPAFEAALKEHREELEAIAHNAAPPTFANTIAAFDTSGRLFNRISLLFNNLTSSETSPALQEIERRMAQPLAAHNNAIYMNKALFKRIDSLFETRASLVLSGEEARMLERIHLDFVRAGAKLAPAAQARYGAIMERLAALSTQFSQNLLADESSYELVLTSENDLAGLPEFVRAAARQAALERGKPDAYVITLSRSSITPFLMFSSRRDLREKAFKAWAKRGENGGTTDNRAVAAEIMKLRLEQANLHGYSSFSDYALADTMAGTRDAVNELLMRVWTPAKAKVRVEAAALQAMAASLGDDIKIEAWDWRYYAEKVRKAQFDLDEAALKPYFPLPKMVEAVFDCAQRLFGITFTEKPALKAYHPDVKVYEVRNAGDNSLVGIFLHDNFARTTKRGGAWMSMYRAQSRIHDARTMDAITPIIVNNNNFAKGREDTGGEPTLLSFDDARTLFHEFGHGLHGLLSNVRFERLSGTRVLRDFVELPSQLFEHWLSEPEVLKRYARHVKTNEAIPDEMITRLQKARTFNQGFENVEFVASALVDMALHSRTDMNGLDLDQFERDELAKIGMPDEIIMRHRLPHFGHLFSSAAYASAYYVYLWAAVLDNDGFEAFTEAGNAFDHKTAQRLKKYIYASGNSLPPMQAYESFRGRAPTVDAMLRRRGLAEA